ncbi:MAG: hypothetical protein ACYCW6_14925 [Candidatus Xenobia bacterium]
MRGFSLLEVVFAAALLALTLFALVAIVPAALAAAKQAQYVVAATNLAQETLEDTMASPFDDVHAVSDAPTVVDGVTYHASLDVTPNGLLKQVVVRVWWDSGAAPRTRTNTPVVLTSCLFRVSR